MKHYKTSILDVELNNDINSVKATHNGYIDDEAIHTREIIFDRLVNEFQIIDTITVATNRKTQIEIPFHLHPDIEIANLSNKIYSVGKKFIRTTEIHIDEKLNPVVLKGEDSPQILGWYSDSFLKKEPTSVIYCKTIIESTTTFKFLIKIL
jgi:hypothetical protein